MTKERIMLACVTVGMLLIGVAIVIPVATVLSGHSYITPLFKYIYALGAVLVLVGRVFNPYKGSNTKLKRLFRIESWGAVFFCVAAFFLFYPSSPYLMSNMRDALAFTLAGGIIQIITSIMIPREAKKHPESLSDPQLETKKKKKKKK